MVITTTTLPGGTIGSFYSGPINVIGGTPPYKFQIVNGCVDNVCGDSLPPGLSLTSTGVITGFPTGPAGTYAGVIEVTDSGSPTQYAYFGFLFDVQ